MRRSEVIGLGYDEDNEDDVFETCFVEGKLWMLDSETCGSECFRERH